MEDSHLQKLWGSRGRTSSLHHAVLNAAGRCAQGVPDLSRGPVTESGWMPKSETLLRCGSFSVRGGGASILTGPAQQEGHRLGRAGPSTEPGGLEDEGPATLWGAQPCWPHAWGDEVSRLRDVRMGGCWARPALPFRLDLPRGIWAADRKHLPLALTTVPTSPCLILSGSSLPGLSVGLEARPPLALSPGSRNSLSRSPSITAAWNASLKLRPQEEPSPFTLLHPADTPSSPRSSGPVL